MGSPEGSAAYRHCGCRPPCLAPVLPEDAVLHIDGHLVLIDHLARLDPFPAEQHDVSRVSA